MQVRAGGLTTVAHVSDLLSGGDTLPDGDGVVVDVPVHRHGAVVMKQPHPQAETGRSAGVDDLTIGGRKDGVPMGAAMSMPPWCAPSASRSWM